MHRHAAGLFPVRRDLAGGDSVTGADHAQPPGAGPQRYEVVVRGHLGETIRSAFPGLVVADKGDDTVLTLAGADQAALYGVLAGVETLGLELLAVRQLPALGPEIPQS